MLVEPGKRGLNCILQQQSENVLTVNANIKSFNQKMIFLQDVY